MHLEFSVVIPAFREEGAIGDVVRGLAEVLPRTSTSFEILVIDDGSDDRTAERARAAGARVITHPYNKGYGASLKTGIRAAKGHTVVFMDADGQHRSEDLARLLSNRERYDMVVGQRKGTAGSPLWRKPGKRVLTWVVNRLAGRRIPLLSRKGTSGPCLSHPLTSTRGGTPILSHSILALCVRRLSVRTRRFFTHVPRADWGAVSR